MAGPSLQFQEVLSSVCSLRPRPLLLTGLFIDLLVKHFQDGNIEDPVLRQLIWKDSPDTGILIETIHRWRPQTTGKRPAIIVKRNAYSNRRVGIGDRHQMNPADASGHQHFTTYWAGSHTLFCLGGSGAQAELLSAEVQRELTQFGPLIRQAALLDRIQVMEIGPVAEIEEATESFGVPVTVGYGYQENWQIRKQAPALSRVSLSLLLEC